MGSSPPIGRTSARVAGMQLAFESPREPVGVRPEPDILAFQVLWSRSYWAPDSVCRVFHFGPRSERTVADHVVLN